MFNSKRMKGFGLIEILVTLGIMTVGILGVTTLHSVVTQQSTENKARTEALQIAESRIETMRNITGSVSTPEAFDSLYANTNGYANSLSITGVSAIFTREESITTASDVKSVAVRVSWTDADGESQSVSLNTRLSYVSPRSAGDSALESAEQLVDAPTGRARLGDGTIGDDVETTSNSDGTSLYKDGSTELRLVDETQDTRQIVLTLSDACQTNNGICIDFVKIKGRIYIDTSSQNQLDPGEVFVIASDAAYCARHYTSGGTTTAVLNSTTTANATTNGHYKYFDYTCYLGGGWHGNIGILLSGGNGSQDKFCIGDPTATALVDPQNMPVIAARRVYRGMLYKYKSSQAGGIAHVTSSGTTTYVEKYGSTTLPRYYSQGIEDSTVFPVPGTTQHTHDFVIGKMSASLTDGSNCTSQGIMTRTDATVSGVTGGLFDNVPTDFICLNDGYLDTYSTSTFGNDTTCPYDPSDPPSDHHTITGSIRLTTTQTAGNLALAAAMYAKTSDGAGNCTPNPLSTMTWDAGGYYTASYSCDIYDWGAGWNGFVQVAYDASNISCTTTTINYTAVTGDDSSGNDFTTCSTGSYAVISGTVTASGSRKLSTATMSNGGSCTVAANGLSYQCVSSLLQSPTTWSGNLAFTITSGYLCQGSPLSFSNKAGGSTTTQNLKIASNVNGC